eukprot:7384189-Prymnesium_polylepis.1
MLWITGRRLLRRARCRPVGSRPPPAQAYEMHCRAVDGPPPHASALEVPCCRWPAAACLGGHAAVLWIAGRHLLRRVRCRAVGSRPPLAWACELLCCG